VNEIVLLEDKLITGAAELLSVAMRLAQATGNPAMLRRAEMLHDAQGLAPVLTITCLHGDSTALAVALGYADPDSGVVKAELFALSAQAEQLQ